MSDSGRVVEAAILILSRLGADRCHLLRVSDYSVIESPLKRTLASCVSPKASLLMAGLDYVRISPN